MKFARFGFLSLPMLSCFDHSRDRRYLQETQTPEWKKAYIDYDKFKECLSAIKQAQKALPEPHIYSPIVPQDVPLISPQSPDILSLPYSRPRSMDIGRIGEPPQIVVTTESKHIDPSLQLSQNIPSSPVEVTAHGESSDPSALSHRPSTSYHKQSFVRRLSQRGQGARKNLSVNIPQPQPSLQGLLAQLSPQELAFFIILDAEFDKIELFFVEREKEMRARNAMLHEQLDELSDHRKVFHDVYQNYQPWLPELTSRFKFLFSFKRMNRTPSIAKSASYKKTQDQNPHHMSDGKERYQLVDEQSKNDIALEKHSSMDSVPSFTDTGFCESGVDEEKGLPVDSSTTLVDHSTGAVRSKDPDDYLQAKKKLKKAILEHYRGLEVLHNYWILNTTGFSKALGKFERVTKIPVLHQYMTEKVEKSAIGSDKTIRTMIKEMEDMYAAVFAKGDRKIATRRLRTGSFVKSHHYSTFRSGIFLGLALHAFAAGLYRSFQESTREVIQGWDALLLVYGILLIPLLFTILVGVNLLVWKRSRINYTFIFELDVQTQLDHREYFETPSMLLAALGYAFWLSFSRIGAHSISPTLWPLIWLGFVAVVMINPFPILFKSSRYWLIKNVGKLLISGSRRVKFTDFWMGDQFCSMIFSISHLYFFVCVYVEGFDKRQKCGSASRNWPVAFILAALPLLVRLVQSIKRYVDSGLITHLINGGKYILGILSYLFYYMWRHHGSSRDAYFVLWCVFNIHYSVYALSWDLLMDWSLLRPHSRHFLLRPELGYSNHISLYYFAIISNVVLRFIWVFYIPINGPSEDLRSFILGMLEILRRWQWNIYRLENEHLGNMDQYRVTREVPLPYSSDNASAFEEQE